MILYSADFVQIVQDWRKSEMRNMTIDEAAKKWCVTTGKVIDYICKGYILGISCREDKLVIPDIPTPATRGNAKSTNVEAVFKKILSVCNRMEYTNAAILGITGEQFEYCMNELEKHDYIQKNNPSADFRSNLYWSITLTGVEMLSKRKFSLPGITINNPVGIQNTAKIGLANF